MIMRTPILVLLLNLAGNMKLRLLLAAEAQDINANTFPHNYSGIPNGGYGTEWQKYFEVTDALPNVAFNLVRSFAGSVSVNRAGHPNDTLFFWGFEKDNGSLTSMTTAAPWIIWLNGGPGSSSLLGLLSENGPIEVTTSGAIVPNNFSWNTLADTIWVDQPVGTGFSTADSTGYISDEDQMAEDFLGFLSNLVKIFPSLAARPLYLTGESYAGVYIPYIARALLSSQNPPVQLRKFAIGDGAIGSEAVYEELPVLSVLETYPQLINFDQDVFEYFQTQNHLCGYDLNLTYPQNGHFPSISALSAFEPGRTRSLRKGDWTRHISERYQARVEAGLVRRDLEKREAKRKEWKRDLTGRANGTIDPEYGCFMFDEMMDYAVNFSFPWSLGGFDVYDIPDALNPEVAPDLFTFMNDNRTRTALHAPTSKDWTEDFNYPFDSGFEHQSSSVFGDPSVEPMAFLSELASMAASKNVSMVFYSGNDDSLVAHRGTEVVIQNTTFGGIQGFTRKPSTPWFDDDGNLAGVVHQERNLTYVLFLGAGHMVPQYVPQATYVFLREFVLGSNTTGLVTTSADGDNRTTSVIGGESPAFESAYVNPALVNKGGIVYYGSGTTASSTVAPSASQEAWATFLATAEPASSAMVSTSSTSSAWDRSHGYCFVWLMPVVGMMVFLLADAL